MVKLLKSFLFFVIIMGIYPSIIGFISTWTFSLARDSIYPSIKEHFGQTVDIVEEEFHMQVVTGLGTVDQNSMAGNVWRFKHNYMREIKLDRSGLFKDMSLTKQHRDGMVYTVIAPAEVIKVIFFLAGQCLTYADDKDNKVIPEFSRVLKGIITAFFAILTGVFALLEYIVCFLEFMLVASVGIILFPFSMWDGSKFLSEKFIGAIVGFFIKMLLCNIAIMLMLYGYVSLFYIISHDKFVFTAEPAQIIFIVFTCLLFFFICKSAPAIASSLLTGTPNLSGTGAISAAAGAVAAVGATAAIAGNVGKTVASTGAAVAGGTAKAAFSVGGSLAEADSAAETISGAFSQ
jgi:hypothetical protein